MTTLLLRRAVTPLGGPDTLDYRLRLVDAAGSPIGAVRLADSAPVRGTYLGTITAEEGEPLALPLLSQEEMATIGGVPSWWELSVRPGGVGQVDTYLLSVPASEVPLNLLALMDAQAAPVDQSAAMAARIAALEANQLPAGTEGDLLIYTADGWAASPTLPIEDLAP